MGLNPATKTAGDIATYVKRQFGDESGVQITDADIFRWIDSAQLEIIALVAPVKAKATTDVVANQQTYDLTGLSVHQIESIHYQGNFVPPKAFAEAERLIYQGTSPEGGDPSFWYEFAGQVYLFPVPSYSTTAGLDIFYTKTATPIVDGTTLLTVPDKYFDSIAAWVLSKAYELDEAFDQANNQRNIFVSQISEQNGEERQSANMTYPVITYIGD